MAKVHGGSGGTIAKAAGSLAFPTSFADKEVELRHGDKLYGFPGDNCGY